MTQDTRKDPRAKVLTMTVRYKSATVDEFIEQYSLDISRGGIFIKTSSPFKAGTLLKFEIRIAEDRTVLQGVGRVVWKREPADAGQLRPAGMGVKFIKIDEASKQIIEELVQRHAESGATYETGLRESEAAAVLAAEGGAAEPTAPTPPRKATMIGLGGMDAAAVIAAANAQAAGEGDAEEAAGGGEGSSPSSSFFPETDSLGEMPPLGEQTVMRQASELLEEALLGAGGTMDEIGAIGAQPLVDEAGQGAGLELSKAVSPSVFPAARSSASSQSLRAIPVDIPSMDGADGPPADETDAQAPVEEVKPTEVPDGLATAAMTPKVPSEPPPAAVEAVKSPAPPPVSTAIASASSASSSKPGGGRGLIYLGLVAAAAAGLYFAFGGSSEEKPSEPAPTPIAAEEKPEPITPPPTDPKGEEAEEAKETEESAEPAAAADEKAPPSEPKDPPTRPAVAPVERAKPAPVKTATPKPQAEAPAPKPAAEKPAAKPVAEKPAAKPATDASKPAAPAAEKPKPAPKPADDNPY